MSNNFNQKVEGLVFIGIILLMMINFVGCLKGDGKSSSDGSANVGNVSVGSVKDVGKATPASDFQYDLTEDGKGIVIRKYKGKGGKVVIPAKIEDYPVLEISGQAFKGRDMIGYFDANNITEIVLPNNVTKIGIGAFSNIDNLKSANIPASIKEIGDFAFKECGNLETLTIPASLTTKIYFIDYGIPFTFFGCGKLSLKTRQRLKELGYEGPF